ncbi:UNVERIFIED_ORG: hypothetical protein M2348_000093 [Sphingomonas sp. R1F5B]
MSRFDAQSAASLALHAIRLPVDASAEYRHRQEETAPLRGKEAVLLGALQEAERAHDDSLAAIRGERARLIALRAARPESKKLADHLGKALEVWATLDNERRKGIAWFANASGEGGAWDGTDRYLDGIATEFGKQLRAMHDAARSVAEDVKFSAGRIAGVSQGKGQLPQDRPELGPLVAFAVVLRDFWRAETGDARFGYPMHKSG